MNEAGGVTSGRVPISSLPRGRSSVLVMVPEAGLQPGELVEVATSVVHLVMLPPDVDLVLGNGAFDGSECGIACGRDGDAVSAATTAESPSGPGCDDDSEVDRVFAEMVAAAEWGAAVEASVATGMTPADLPTAKPGVQLAQFLAGVAPGDLDDADLVEDVAAWKRLSSWAEAHAAFAAGELDSRASMRPAWPSTAGNVGVQGTAGDELMMRLACSRRSAQELTDMGRVFREHMELTGHALASGEIDVVKARKIVTTLLDEHPLTAFDVQERVLSQAQHRSPDQLDGDLRRALIDIDPEGAAERAQAAKNARRVCRPRPRADGMAGLWALLPAATAVKIDAELDASARAARSGGDGRTIDQLRADLFADLLLDGAGPGGALLVPQVFTEDAPAAERVPSAADGTLCAADAARDHDAAPDQDAGPYHDAARDQDTAPDQDAASDHDAAPDQDQADGVSSPLERRRRRRRHGSRVLVNVTVPYDVLAGVSDRGGELEGFGAISAETARLIASDATWRRILTDPASGTVLDVGRTRYRPPAALAEHVRARDRRCARPGCSAVARSCDLDHTIEFTRQNGTTAHTNLGPLCPRDHQIKTDGGFTVTQPAPGVFVWETPTGHVYRVRPGSGQAYEVLRTGTVVPESTWDERRVARRRRYVDEPFGAHDSSPDLDEIWPVPGGGRQTSPWVAELRPDTGPAAASAPGPAADHGPALDPGADEPPF